MTAAEILRKAAKLIDAPEKWTQGEWARDKAGQKVAVLSRNAVCFCAEGAILRAAHVASPWGKTRRHGTAFAARYALRGILSDSLSWFNDRPETTAKDIKSVMIRAAEKLEAGV